MRKRNVKIGVVPTIRNLMFWDEALKIRKQMLDKVKGLGAEIVDIEDVNKDGVLLEPQYKERIINKLKENDVDGVFFPHINFGTEDLVGKIAKAIDRPVLIWGPRDEPPTAQGDIKRFSQTGIFATGKVLRHYNIPFTYINNCELEDDMFGKGFRIFTSVCSVVQAFKNIRILQIAPRPASFWSVMVNESELLEKYGIEIYPITLSDIISLAKDLKEKNSFEYQSSLNDIKNAFCLIDIENDALEKIACLKAAISKKTEELKCCAAAIQCWDTLQREVGIMPCALLGMLYDEGLPVACETDIHGAVSSIMLQEAADRSSPVFFADLTMRHPQNDNAELLWHCGNFPYSLAKEESKRHLENISIFEHHCPGAGHFQLKDGDITICRFDGDHGAYNLLIGEGKSVDGPKVNGTYVWFEVKDWPKWERKIVTGPYIHHISGIHAKVAPILYEACKYIDGLTADPLEPSGYEIEKFLTDYK